MGKWLVVVVFLHYLLILSEQVPKHSPEGGQVALLGVYWEMSVLLMVEVSGGERVELVGRRHGSVCLVV